MKTGQLIRYLPNLITGFMPQLARGFRNNQRQRQIRRNKWFFNNTNNRRRRRRNGRFNNLEINNADGGLKQNYSKQQTRLVPINFYGRLVAAKYDPLQNGVEYFIQLQQEEYAFNNDFVNLTAQLNNAPEFRTWRTVSTQYKVKSVNTTINYNYHASTGDYIPRLMMIYDTDTIQTSNLNFENNAMGLDFSKVGTKNYNIRLNKRNMAEDNVDWQNSNNSYLGRIDLKIAANDVAYFADNNIEYRILGTIKFSINVLFRLKDVQTEVNERVRRGNRFDIEIELKDGEKKEDIIKLIKNVNVDEGSDTSDLNDNKTDNKGTQVNFSELQRVVGYIPLTKEESELLNKDSRMLDLFIKLNDSLKIFMNQMYQLTKLCSEGDQKLLNKMDEKDYQRLRDMTSMDTSDMFQFKTMICSRFIVHLISHANEYAWNNQDEDFIKDKAYEILNSTKNKIPMMSKEFSNKIDRARKNLIKNEMNKKKNSKKRKNKKKMEENHIEIDSEDVQ